MLLTTEAADDSSSASATASKNSWRAGQNTFSRLLTSERALLENLF
jgi:hypothetical protein